MKKTLIASAVAAAALSTNTFAMDNATDLAEMLEGMPTIYGNIQLVNTTVDDGDDSNSGFGDNGSTLGFTHESAVSEDVTAFFKAEFHFAADEAQGFDDENDRGADESYIGLKGGFGSVQIGSDDTVAEWSDHVDIEEGSGGLNSDLAGMDEGDNLQYVSPEIGEGLTVGVTLPLDLEGTDAYNMAVAAGYEMDNMAFSLTYANGRDDFESAIGLAGTISLDDLSLTAQYETQKDNADVIALLATYSMGANSFALGYAMTEQDGGAEEETTNIYLQAIHNVSDNVYVWTEYTDTSLDVADTDSEIFEVGATYAF